MGELVAIEIIEPNPQPPPERDYIFEEVEAICKLKLGDEVIQVIQTLNDYYGQGKGVEQAIKDMEKYSKQRNLNQNSDVEVIVVERKTQHRYRPTRRESMTSPGYLDFELLRFGYSRDLPDPKEKTVWSSKVDIPRNS